MQESKRYDESPLHRGLDHMTLFHESCKADEIVMTFRNDINVSQFHCELLVSVLVTIDPWKIYF